MCLPSGANLLRDVCAKNKSETNSVVEVIKKGRRGFFSYISIISVSMISNVIFGYFLNFSISALFQIERDVRD